MMQRSELVDGQWYRVWSRKQEAGVPGKKVKVLDKADEYPTFEIPGEGLVGIPLSFIYGECDAPTS